VIKVETLAEALAEGIQTATRPCRSFGSTDQIHDLLSYLNTLE
jgi:hypothetical protein